MSMDGSNQYHSGENFPTASNLAQYAWLFEDAGNGYYYIKTTSGKYLRTDKDTTYFVTEGDKIEDDNHYLWMLVSRGGDMFYLSNKYVHEDSTIIQYMCFDPSTRIQFYTDLLVNGDQVMRFVNVETDVFDNDIQTENLSAQVAILPDSKFYN